MGLADLDFTGLILEETNGHVGRAYMRGLRGSGGVQSVPAEASADVTQLFEHIQRSLRAESGRKDDIVVRLNEQLYRVSVVRSARGHSFVIRRIPFHLPTLRDLRFPQRLTRLLVETARRPGLILFVGGSGEGKTTSATALLAALLRHYGDVAYTIEAPPEADLEGNNPFKSADPQRDVIGMCYQWRDVTEHTMHEYLARTMRLQPRFIFLGEVRYEEVVRQMLQASLNGHVVLSTMHAGGIVAALERIVAMGGSGAEHALAEGLNAIVHQSLNGHDRVPAFRPLFVAGQPEERAIRAVIRNREFSQLKNAAISQTNNVMQG